MLVVVVVDDVDRCALLVVALLLDLLWLLLLVSLLNNLVQKSSFVQVHVVRLTVSIVCVWGIVCVLEVGG